MRPLSHMSGCCGSREQKKTYRALPHYPSQLASLPTWVLQAHLFFSKSIKSDVLWIEHPTYTYRVETAPLEKSNISLYTTFSFRDASKQELQERRRTRRCTPSNTTVHGLLQSVIPTSLHRTKNNCSDSKKNATPMWHFTQRWRCS